MINPQNILFIDEDNLQTNTRAQLLHEMRDHNVDVVDSLEEVKELYTEDRYDIVIIDFVKDFGVESLKYIDSVNPAQKMITISADEAYSEQKGCQYCVSSHRRRRLVPPFSFPELVSLIENFDLTTCVHKEEFQSIPS